jgi:outer membrane protein assembly factor BamB
VKSNRTLRLLPLGVAGLAAAAGLFWLWPRPDPALRLRIPGTDAAPGVLTGGTNPVFAGQIIAGPGQPTQIPGSWPQFRGPNRDGMAAGGSDLARTWKTAPPRELWSLEVGEGYAGPAVSEGRVYLLDYEREAKRSVLRCLSLADGKEIWRYEYPLTIKRNHGMTRTVPAVAGGRVVALDSKCHVICLDAVSGELKWSADLVREYGAAVPEWYAGQCPFVDGDKVILAPGGPDALLLALDLATGQRRWQTPNRHGWKMTHASIATMEGQGRKQYIYCADKGVVGVDAADGSMLWETTDWKISIATVPTPVPLTDGRIFLTGGYGAGSLFLELDNQPTGITARTALRLGPEIFGATQHTPIFKDNRLYGIRADGRLVCLGLDGKVVWASNAGETFGLGPLVMVGDLILALNDAGKLRLIQAGESSCEVLGEIQPLNGREAWAPMALAGNRLLLRDLARLVCLELPGQ